VNLHQSTWKRAALVGAALALGALSVLAAESWDGTLVQYGTMHDAVGKQNHQGRVALNTLVDQPHFFGVAALEKLEGEITVFDSDATVTGVAADGKLAPLRGEDLQATLLIGAYVPAWTDHKVEHDVAAADFDQMVRDAATRSGVDVSKPFVFTVEGEFTDVRMHVINGACPMHARLKKIEIPAEQKPFEGEYKTIRGRLVGVYATDAVGKLTHPATSTHVHLIFEDASGEKATGHVERIGLATGTVLKLPTKG
jgi:alpha-acetolactate decarboxylase